MTLPNLALKMEWTVLALLLSISSVSALAEPTPAPTPAPTGPTATNAHIAYGQLLFGRQEEDCPGGTYMCTGQGFEGICCAQNQVCELDDDNEPACCPSGAVCTGTAPASPGPAPTGAASYVPNSYFPFPYIATSLDQGECSSAVSQCSENYDTCVTELSGGDDNGDGEVTIVVPGGNGGGDGTTVVGNAPSVGSESATQICSSLSSQACRDLDTTDCDQPTSVNGIVIESDSGARPTMACAPGMVAGVGVGVAVLGALR